MALTEEKKKLLQEDYESGELPVTVIAKKHSVSRATVIRLAKNCGWSRESRPKMKQLAKKETPKKGRPESYKPEYTEQAYKLCLLGLTDKELADFFEVSEVTLNAWKKRHPVFLKSLKEGKVLADADIAESLHIRAKGYESKEDRLDKEGNPFVVTTHIPANPVSQIFWLKNRQPDHWREKQEIAVTDRTLRTTIPEREPIEDEKDFSDFVVNELSK